MVKQNDGILGFGTYAVDEPTNNISFSGITLTIPIAGYIIVAHSAADKFKILSVEKPEQLLPVFGWVNGILQHLNIWHSTS